ncbi:MAG: histidine kinase dimerization/phospho-acceptor domain-containing protein, partial [Bacteroidota bacterium]
PEYNVDAMLVDEHDNVWLGTDGGGLIKFPGTAFVHFGTNSAITDRSVFAIREFQDYFLIGTERGLFDLKDGAFQKINGVPGDVPFIYEICVESDELVIIASSRGVMTFDGQRFKQIRDNDGSRTPNFTGITCDAEDRIWMAGRDGFVMYNGDSLRNMAEVYPELDVAGTDAFTDSKGRIWLLSERNGVYLLENGEIQHFFESNGLAGNRLYTIAEDKKGRVWVGTKTGLSIFDGENITNLTTKEGLNANLIYILQPDALGNMWAGSERGLNRIRISETGLPSIQTFGKAEGFTSVECNQSAGYLDAENNLWFGTVFGLTCFDPQSERDDEQEPHIEIRSLKLHLEDVDWVKRGDSVMPWSGIPVDPKFNPDDNHLRFDYKAVVTHLPDKVRYRYKLEQVGEEEEWSPFTKETSATYSNIEPGSYVFSVEAYNSDEVRTSVPAKFAFTIPTPFHQTWWFSFLVLAGIFLVTYIAVKVRINALTRTRQILEEKVSERTKELEQANQVKSEFLAKMSHEIRTPMNGVIGMTDLLARTELDDQQKRFVENVRVSGQNLLAIINDILDFSRIESGKLELESVPVDLRQLIEEVLDILAYGAYAKGLELLYYVDPEIRGPVMADAARLKQILVNLVGNAIKFTENGRIVVRVKLQSKKKGQAQIRFSIKDSGIGIPEEKFN